MPLRQHSGTSWYWYCVLWHTLEICIVGHSLYRTIALLLNTPSSTILANTQALRVYECTTESDTVPFDTSPLSYYQYVAITFSSCNRSEGAPVTAISLHTVLIKGQSQQRNSKMILSPLLPRVKQSFTRTSKTVRLINENNVEPYAEKHFHR